MVFQTRMEFSKNLQLFAESPARFSPVKRSIDLVDDDEKNDAETSHDSLNDSWMSVDMNTRTDPEGKQLFIEKKWRLQTVVSHRVYPLLFHPHWRHEITKSVVHVDKFGSYKLELEGRHASEFCALLNALDELSQVKPYNIVYEMVYRKFVSQGYSSPTNEAKFLLKFVYLAAFYKAGWKPQQISLKEFFTKHSDLINDMARELLPNAHNPIELYMDDLDREDECRMVYVMLASTEPFCQSEWLAENVLQKGEKKRRNWPAELKQMLVQKVIEQTRTQQHLFKHAASEHNFRCLPSPASSLMALRLVNSSFKAVVDKVIQKSCRFYRPIVAVGNCLRDGELIQLPVKNILRIQPTYTFCSPQMLRRIDPLLDPQSAVAYVYLQNTAGEQIQYLNITNEEQRFRFDDALRDLVYMMSVNKLLH